MTTKIVGEIPSWRKLFLGSSRVDCTITNATKRYSLGPGREVIVEDVYSLSECGQLAGVSGARVTVFGDGVRVTIGGEVHRNSSFIVRSGFNEEPIVLSSFGKRLVIC